MKNHILIQEDDFLKARKKIRENRQNAEPLATSPKLGQSKDKIVIFSSDKDELNRKIIEKEKIDVLLLNQSKRKDRLKQRDSGLNHVLAKLAKKKHVSIGINLDEIIKSGGKKRADMVARVKQNIKLCNKNKLKMKFIGTQKRNLYDLKALGLVLGMPTWMMKEL